MTIQQWLNRSQQLLADTGIATGRLDCLVLLEDVLNTNRTQILANLHLLIPQKQQKTLNELVARRSTHEPLAYIRNKTEFYGREFYIDHHVLEPRSESEAMIDELKQLTLPESAVVIDVGTGSGALAITAKFELPKANVIGIDIDAACLEVAARNAKKLDATITFLQGNLLEPLANDAVGQTVLLCNLPYVPDNFQINPAAMREPRLAIFGGPDGITRDFIQVFKA